MGRSGGRGTFGTLSSTKGGSVSSSTGTASVGRDGGSLGMMGSSEGDGTVVGGCDGTAAGCCCDFKGAFCFSKTLYHLLCARCI